MNFSAKKLTFIFLFFSCFSFGQRVYDNYSIDVNYGLSGAYAPSITELSHIDFGFRYMFGEKWGIKLDYGTDKFRTQKSPTEMGTDYQRISVQAVGNLNNILDDRSYFYNEYFCILAHAGGGYAWQKSVSFPAGAGPGIDEIPHMMIGLNPQYTFAEGFSVGIDATAIMNLAQHVKFDGTRVSRAADNATTTYTYNLSLGLSYTFGGK